HLPGRKHHPVDETFMQRLLGPRGAYIMGRNMFGPVRGEWGDSRWRGWWGPEPPYHAPVFVLTHYPHDPITMEGGTTFYFVDGFETASLTLLRAAARVTPASVSIFDVALSFVSRPRSRCSVPTRSWPSWRASKSANATARAAAASKPCSSLGSTTCRGTVQ